MLSRSLSFAHSFVLSLTLGLFRSCSFWLLILLLFVVVFVAVVIVVGWPVGARWIRGENESRWPKARGFLGRACLTCVNVYGERMCEYVVWVVKRMDASVFHFVVECVKWNYGMCHNFPSIFRGLLVALMLGCCCSWFWLLWLNIGVVIFLLWLIGSVNCIRCVAACLIWFDWCLWLVSVRAHLHGFLSLCLWVRCLKCHYEDGQVNFMRMWPVGIAS